MSDGTNPIRSIIWGSSARNSSMIRPKVGKQYVTNEGSIAKISDHIPSEDGDIYFGYVEGSDPEAGDYAEPMRWNGKGERSKPYFSLVSESQRAFGGTEAAPLSIMMETYPVEGPVKPRDGEDVIVGSSLRGSWGKAVYSAAEDCYRGPGGDRIGQLSWFGR